MEVYISITVTRFFTPTTVTIFSSDNKFICTPANEEGKFQCWYPSRSSIQARNIILVQFSKFFQSINMKVWPIFEHINGILFERSCCINILN